jgi:phosphate transport system substrate-binding protein
MVALGAATFLTVALAACGGSTTTTSGTVAKSAGGGTINGAGSTFAAPIYEQWGSNLASQGVTVNYQAVGSGAGIADLQAGTVNFAASDPPMKSSEIAAASAKGTPVHIPTAFGAITVSYNLPGIPSGLKLDGGTIANIFLGKIKTWNDPAIKALNPSANLPSTAIAVVHRSDSSGTTQGFTTFLSDYSPTWKSQVGLGKDVKWPTGTGAKGNAGVAGAIKQTTGAVGYVEQAYALQNNFTYASVKNRSGTYITPTLASTTASGTGIRVPGDLRFTAINSPNKQAYPIVSQTFLIVYRDLCKAGSSQSAATEVVKFLNYALGSGQSVLGQLEYSPLPSSLLAMAKTKVTGLQCNGSPITG